ncbi:MAG: Serine/arginine-rich splicing factor 12, partial [Paramarteilia canceri]
MGSGRYRESSGNSGRSLFIRRVPDRARTGDFRKIFSRYGTVKDVYIPNDYYSGRTRGIAYVEFEDRVDINRVVRKTDGISLYGNEIAVKVAEGCRK